jgi:hypothetical protein
MLTDVVVADASDIVNSMIMQRKANLIHPGMANKIKRWSGSS